MCFCLLGSFHQGQFSCLQGVGQLLAHVLCFRLFVVWLCSLVFSEPQTKTAVSCCESIPKVCKVGEILIREVIPFQGHPSVGSSICVAEGILFSPGFYQGFLSLLELSSQFS